MSRKTTSDGRYVIYHLSEAGCPEAHQDRTDDGQWFFEPVDYRSNEVYSVGYPTPEAAAAAASEWDKELDGVETE